MGSSAAAAVLVAMAGISLFSRPSVEKDLQAASALLVRGEYAPARAVYDRVLKQIPGHRDAMAGKEEIRRRQLEDAEKMLEQGRPADALEAFMLVLIEDPMQKRAQEGKEEAKRRMTLPTGKRY